MCLNPLLYLLTILVLSEKIVPTVAISGHSDTASKHQLCQWPVSGCQLSWPTVVCHKSTHPHSHASSSCAHPGLWLNNQVNHSRTRNSRSTTPSAPNVAQYSHGHRQTTPVICALIIAFLARVHKSTKHHATSQKTARLSPMINLVASSHLLCTYDQLNGCHFLIDTGPKLSIYPPSPQQLLSDNNIAWCSCCCY